MDTKCSSDHSFRVQLKVIGTKSRLHFKDHESVTENQIGDIDFSVQLLIDFNFVQVCLK